MYAGLEILTAQPALPGSVPHHLIGFLSPAEPFDAARFASLAGSLIPEIQARGKTPILTGGSGLYLKALTHGLADAPAPDPALRAELSALPDDELRRRLGTADPKARELVDFQNPRRVLRALEIHLLTGRTVAESRQSWASKETPGFRGLLLHRDREELDTRIAANVDAMFARGVVAEVAALGDPKFSPSAFNVQWSSASLQLPPGNTCEMPDPSRALSRGCSEVSVQSPGPTAFHAIGLREIQALLRGEMTEPECRAAIILATRRYAKRQLTWFRNQFNFSVLDLTGRRPEQALSSALNLLGDAHP